MNIAAELEALRQRNAPLEIQPGEFREIGHRLVDQIADRLAQLPDRLVTPDESPATFAVSNPRWSLHSVRTGRMAIPITLPSAS